MEYKNESESYYDKYIRVQSKKIKATRQKVLLQKKYGRNYPFKIKLIIPFVTFSLSWLIKYLFKVSNTCSKFP